MSGSEQYEKVTVSSDGVTVDKRFEEDEFPVPAIAFEIRSSRSETVTVTLVDEVPEGVAVEDLGFHPEYGSEYWTIDESEITFERELEAESEYTTVYGIRATGTDDVQQFLTTPRVAEVDPPLDDDDLVVDQGSSDVVRDVIAGESDAVPGLEDQNQNQGQGQSDGEDEDVGTLDLKDPNAPDEAGESTTEDGASEAEGDSGGSGVNSVVGALAAELHNGNVEDQHVEILRDALGASDDGANGSVDARIQRLQTELSDLQAYTEALEEFLDDNGTAEQMIEDFQSDVSNLQSELDEVGEIARSHEESLSNIESTVERVESSMEALESEMDGVVGDVEGVQSDVSEVRETVDDVEGTVDDLESQVGDIDVEDIRTDIDAVEADIQELNEWRDQLSSVIGGGGD